MKKTIFKIILLLGFSSALVIASYAWFADKSNPSINISNIQVSAADGLVIKLQPDSAARTNINLNNVLGNLDSFELKQVSSANAQNFYTIDFNQGVAMSTPEFVLLPSANGSNTQMISNGYVDFDFYLQTEEYPKHVYIHKDTLIDGAAWEAIRVSITYPTSANTTSTIIFGSTPENGITDPYTTKAIITTGTFTYGSIPSSYYTNQLVRTLDYRNGGRGTSDDDELDTDKVLFSMAANTRVAMNIKIWLEGGDIDCTNTLASTIVNAVVKFGSANQLLAAPTLTGNTDYTIIGLDTTMEWATTNTTTTTWTAVTSSTQAFTGYQSVYVRIAEVVGESPESYATLVTFQ